MRRIKNITSLIIVGGLASYTTIFAFTPPQQAPPNSVGLLTIGASNVGIGITNPSAKLHIAVNAGGVDPLRVDVGGAPALFIKNTTGNIGIGTINPTERLTIIGNAQISGTVVIGSLQLTGTALQSAYGGTGLANPGPAGNILRSTGTIWASVAANAVLPPPEVISRQFYLSSGTSPQCTLGRKVTGGGCYAGHANCRLMSSMPYGSNDQWFCAWWECGGVWNTAYAICQ